MATLRGDTDRSPKFRKNCEDLVRKRTEVQIYPVILEPQEIALRDR
jgi:hypothetical protein